MKDKVAVLGGGAGAHAEAFELATKGFKVNICQVPERKNNFKKTLMGKIKATGKIRGVAKLNLATTDFQEAITDVKTIFLAAPSFAHKLFASYCAPYLEDGQIIVLTPGTGGSLVFAKELRDRGIRKNLTIAETIALPYGARMQEPGHVQIRAKTVNNPIGVFPAKRTDEVVQYLQQFYPEFVPLSNVLEAALNSTNAILHPAATLLNVGSIESGNCFMLYKDGMGPSSLTLMGALVNDRAMIGKAFGLNMDTGDAFQKGRIEALKEFLDSTLGDNSYEAVSRLKGPSSLENRYITEDVPYALVLWESLANAVNVKVPAISSIIEIFSIICGVDFRRDGRTVYDLGLSGLSLSQITKFLHDGEED